MSMMVPDGVYVVCISGDNMGYVYSERDMSELKKENDRMRK